MQWNWKTQKHKNEINKTNNIKEINTGVGCTRDQQDQQYQGDQRADEMDPVVAKSVGLLLKDEEALDR